MCVLVCMTVCVVGERNCADVACCVEVWLCLGVLVVVAYKLGQLIHLGL